MRYRFLAQPEKITPHYGIRPAVFENAVPVYAVVMLDCPDEVVFCLVKHPAAVHYCYDMERAVYGYDSIVEIPDKGGRRNDGESCRDRAGRRSHTA